MCHRGPQARRLPIHSDTMVKLSKNMQKKLKGAIKPKSRARGSTQPVVQSVRALDEGARRHIRLLHDPCNAPLVRPAYETSAGGLLVRYRRMIEFATGAGQTAFVVGFLPHENAVHYRVAADSTTPGALVSQEVFTGLDTVAGASQFSYRCVAACVRGICLTSELNRSGIVCAGSVDSDVVIPTDASQTTSVGTVQGVLPVSTRMPSRAIEVLWTPGESSHQYRTADVAGIVSPLLGTHNNACVLAVSGMPAQTGMRVEFTAVYEVRPANASNVVSVVEPPPSNNTWNQILRQFVAEAGNRVMIEGERAVLAGAAYLGQAVMNRMARTEL